MKALIAYLHQNPGVVIALVVSVAMVVCCGIHAAASRYSHAGHGHGFDRWTGEIFKRVDR